MGLKWNDESHALRFVSPFVEMVKMLEANRHIERNDFMSRFSLTEEEFNALVGRAEEYVNCYL